MKKSCFLYAPAKDHDNLVFDEEEKKKCLQYIDIVCLATNQKKIPFTGAFVNHNNDCYLCIQPTLLLPHKILLAFCCWPNYPSRK